MIEFLSKYGEEILSVIIQLAGYIVTIISFIRMLKSEKRVKSFMVQSQQDILITREGIVEAFKTAKINPEIKISIAKQVDAKLSEWKQEFMSMYKKSEESRTKLTLFVAKIMSNTAAYNKLSNEEKEEGNRLMKEIVEDDGLVEVYLPTED